VAKKRFLTIVVLGLAACSSFQNYESPEGPRYSGGYTASPPLFDGTIKVVSYNIKLGVNSDQAIADLTNIPQLSNADILLLQEMDEDGVDKIARALSDNYVYYPASVPSTTGRDFGNAILARWPISDSRKILLPHARPMIHEKRIAVFAEVRVGGDEVIVVCAQTETTWLGDKGRMDQFMTMARSIRPDAPRVVVGGDFNTTNLGAARAAARAFRRVGLREVSRGIGPTVRGEPTGFVAPQLDHIFVRGMTVLGRGKSRKARASDHFPIWVRLSLEPKAP